VQYEMYGLPHSYTGPSLIIPSTHVHTSTCSLSQQYTCSPRSREATKPEAILKWFLAPQPLTPSHISRGRFGSAKCPHDHIWGAFWQCKVKGNQFFCMQMSKRCHSESADNIARVRTILLLCKCHGDLWLVHGFFPGIVSPGTQALHMRCNPPCWHPHLDCGTSWMVVCVLC
jgi:hypothetical protein